MTTQHRRPADKDLVDVLLTDHQEAESLFRRLESPSLDAAERRALVDVTTAALVRHAVAEEEYLYPAARDLLTDGDAVADRGLADLAEAEQLMKTLEALAPDDPRYQPLCRELIGLTRGHIRDDEALVFPALRAACDAPTLQRLAGMAEMAMTSAPTRAHPAAPDTPPWNMLVAPGVGMVDRLRDAIQHRPTRDI
ncbi:hemerythrin [Pilimelia terevasa]|uniref:Hemerythrin n=1 Tax=Pilimelia terevasa TaxID=53372 RepID=A0A8J3BJK7_9ACTN|nr:hemerythrin domain-containing protein [Pilimelia terevasa]GGK15166.1 hemerythrin [Pilimelia terevasa]